jgi:hypothetical protein
MAACLPLALYSQNFSKVSDWCIRCIRSSPDERELKEVAAGLLDRLELLMACSLFIYAVGPVTIWNEAVVGYGGLGENHETVSGWPI